MHITRINQLLEALAEGRELGRVLISDRRRGPEIERLKELCRERGIPFQFVPQRSLDRRAGTQHQGVFAETMPVPCRDLDWLLANIKSGLVLVLDSIEDAGNLGALARSAAAAGVDGLIFADRGSAPVNDTTMAASAGALARVNLVRSLGLARDLEQLKKNDFWIAAAVAGDGLAPWDCDLRGRLALVLGNESRGVSPLLRKRADFLLTIPLAGGVESLNVAAAAAVLLFEARRQRRPVDVN